MSPEMSAPRIWPAQVICAPAGNGILTVVGSFTAAGTSATAIMVV
jgi:hypothetical protein